MKLYYYISIILFLSGCFSPDEQLIRTGHYDLHLQLDPNERQNYFISLENIDAINNSDLPNWHLKFQNKQDKWGIFLNTLEQLAVHNTNSTDFESIDESIDLTSVEWAIDIPSENGSISAFKGWGDFSFKNPKSFKNVYILAWRENHQDFIFKLQILDATETSYRLKFGTLDGREEYFHELKKESEYNFTYISFHSPERTLLVEPPRSEWDLTFTYLQDSIKNHENYPYISTRNPAFGIYQAMLVNHEFNDIYIDTLMPFEKMDYFYARDLVYQTNDVFHNVFYEWDTGTSSLSVNDRVTMIVRNNDRYYAFTALSIQGDPTDIFTILLRIKQL